jgi:hypothetical protein
MNYTWRIVSFGMLGRVALVRTDVSEELSTSIRVTRMGELRTTLAVTSTRRTRDRRNIPEDTILQSPSRKPQILHRNYIYYTVLLSRGISGKLTKTAYRPQSPVSSTDMSSALIYINFPVYVCMYVYMYVCRYVGMYVCMNACMNVCRYICM